MRMTTEDQLNAHFESNLRAFDVELKLIADLRKSIGRIKPDVQNKDLILALIQLLETEEDVVKLDVYRNALEIIVQKTPDDL
ncbi:biofilm development regulator YmgB/AriR family protein [Yokenella regensburgei]|uniref:biofilm development regulator YmgB/AriR family protein n=1 Tax=Yokenella regensburgei TaxID=158877 RepID=UPI003F5CE9E7